MALKQGRLGFIAAGLQSAFNVPATISNSDYVPFTNNTLHGIQEQLKIQHATGLRDMEFSSVAGKRYSQGDLELLLDSKFAGYFLVGAMGSVSTANVAGSVNDHTITRNNSNTPQYLTIINDRVIDRQLYPNVAVDELELAVGTDLATVKAKLNGSFPQTTTSGTNTTASGNIMSFKNAQFAFGATVAGAQAAANLAPHDFKVSIKNNNDIIHRHGSADAATIVNKGFDIAAEMTLYFENTTDRDTYYNQQKQAASLQFIGNSIGGGLFESLKVNFYQISIEQLEFETGLDNFYAEKVTFNGEYDNANSKSLDMVLRNTKTLYI